MDHSGADAPRRAGREPGRWLGRGPGLRPRAVALTVLAVAAVLGVASLVRPAAPAGDPAATGAASDAAQAGAGRAAVGAVQDVVLVDQGEVARVSVRLTVEGGGASAEPVEVAYRTVAGTALLGTHVEPTAGSLTFAAGSPSGSEAVIDVPTLVTGPGDARTFQVELTAP